MIRVSFFLSFLVYVCLFVCFLSFLHTDQQQYKQEQEQQQELCVSLIANHSSLYRRRNRKFEGRKELFIFGNRFRLCKLWSLLHRELEEQWPWHHHRFQICFWFLDLIHLREVWYHCVYPNYRPSSRRSLHYQCRLPRNTRTRDENERWAQGKALPSIRHVSHWAHSCCVLMDKYLRIFCRWRYQYQSYEPRGEREIEIGVSERLARFTLAWPCLPVFDVVISMILHGRFFNMTKPFLRNAEHCWG